jgi:TldD protein
MSLAHLDIAQKVLLEPAGLTYDHLHQVLANILTRKIDLADLYFQESHSESWVLENNIVKEASYSFERGVGIRAVSGEKTGFAYSNDLSLEALNKAARTAKSIVKHCGDQRVGISRIQTALNLYPAINPLETLKESQKVDLLKRVDQESRKDPRVTQVIAGLSGFYDVILIIGSDGTLAADVRPLIYLSVKVIVEDYGKQEVGVYGGGERSGYECFLKKDIVSKYAFNAVSQALINLEAVEAPAGVMKVVLGPGWPGVLLHESVGHGLEGDSVRKGTSVFANRLGDKIASSSCTIVDDGTLVKHRGSLNIDDEGTPSQYKVLIENGILKDYLQDKLNAKLMGEQSTGNGRRESYACIPIPRMTNTYMLPGEYDPQEIIASVDRGLYAINFAGGQVDTTSGKFVFSTNEAYLIEKGKVICPVKGATLIGNGPDILTKVSMVGNDLQLDSGIGSCGKDGQSVPVGVGQPTLRIDELTVGGTK